MNYKIDVSLSTNEIYTLTFDYTFDESVEDKTIRLQIGDLMVETQNRRIVFKTTSSVTQIKSNVRLENINLYEGNFEDYDQHGEYTKESYLKGRTLINLVTRDMYDSRTQASVTREFTEDGFRKIAITGNGSQYLGGDFWAKNNFVNSSLPEDWDTVYTIIVFVRKNTFPSDISLQFNMRHRGTTGMSGARDLKGEYDIIIKGRETGVYKSTSKICYYNHTLSGRYWGCFSNAWSDTDVAVVDRTDLVGCELEYAVMVVKGDYYDDNITIGHFFEGIGCVKSPTVFSCTKNENLMKYATISSIADNIIISDDNTYIYNGQTARYVGWRLNFPSNAEMGFTNNDFFCLEFDYIIDSKFPNYRLGIFPSITVGGGAFIRTDGDGIGTSTKRLDATIGHFKEYFKLGYSSSVISINSSNNPDWEGKIRKTIFSNIRLYKIDNIDTTDIYDESLVTTPNDLELHGVNESIYDKLDLTTGTLYKNTGFYTLDETFVDATTNWSIATNEATGNVTFTSRQYGTLRSEYNFPYSLYGNAIVSNADVASNIVNNNNIEIARPRLYFDVYSYNNYTVIIMPASYNVTTLDELRTWLQNNNMIIHYKLQTPYTEQIDLKALRCYRDGSIVTDSQQLVPELVTTLPIANKFETTKLISGKTYLIYFDGTATELNVGGETVIANPTSPCEFTCGSTKTLTITGTNIANVMVVEKERKNEQHEINATSIHISKIITTNGLYNVFYEYRQNGTGNGVYIQDRNKIIVNAKQGVALAYARLMRMNDKATVMNLPTGTYKFHCKVKVPKIGLCYRVLAHNNPNGAANNANGFATDKIEATQLIEEINYIGYFSYATQFLFYAYTLDQIEYYDISLIKLSDEDITSSSDIPNINYEETISTPSEPIILREYGGLQDTYDIATGTVTKRVAQSVDSFDLGALSSPETHTVTFDKMPVIYENGTVEFYTEHDLYPIAKFEVPSSNLYDVSNLEANKPYTIRNAKEIYCNGQPVPVRDVMTFTASQLAKGEMVINNSNYKEPMIIEGNFEGREIPSFVGTRSVEALEISVDGEVNQPIFGKGGRR